MTNPELSVVIESQDGRVRGVYCLQHLHEEICVAIIQERCRTTKMEVLGFSLRKPNLPLL